MVSRMKRFSIIPLALVLVMAIGGCIAEQKASFTAAMTTIKTYIDDNKKETDKAIGDIGVALEKVTGLITEAEKDTPPALPENDPIPKLVQGGTDVVAPFLPFPFNLIAGLIPFGVAWYRAKNRADRRTAEERLIIVALQKLKKADKPAFDRFVELRNEAADGVLTAKQISELLEGINQIRTTIT